jgi:hypothetical protein
MVRRRPKTPEVSVLVHTGPGEEAQADFGAAGMFVDSSNRRLRAPYVLYLVAANIVLVVEAHEAKR